jgi:hypothetical protein
MHVLDGAKGLFAARKIRNVIAEMKPNVKEKKITFIHDRIDEGFRVWSFCEDYSGPSFLEPRLPMTHVLYA